MKILFMAVMILISVSSFGYASQWNGFEGIYVGMPSSEAKAKGFTACSKEQSGWKVLVDEICTYGGNDINTLYKEKIKELSIGVKENRVQFINAVASNKHGRSLVSGLLKPLGKPVFQSKDEVHWIKGVEVVDLYSSIDAHTIRFGIDKSIPRKVNNLRPEATESIRTKGRAFYLKLMKMRKEQAFIKYGFDGFGNSLNHDRYQRWLNEAYDLQEECTAEAKKIPKIDDRLQSVLSQVCTAIYHLNTSGQHYARNGGMDDKFTDSKKQEIKAALKIP